MSDEGRRERWRMTLDELCYRAKTTRPELEKWRSIGVFGPRWKEDRDRGPWRHITKEVAHRAIIMRTLLDAGLTEMAAAKIASHHDIKDKDKPLHVNARNVQINVWRGNLRLP